MGSTGVSRRLSADIIAPLDGDLKERRLRLLKQNFSRMSHSMSRGFAERGGKPLEIKGSRLQQGATRKWPHRPTWHTLTD